jgi:hypothetical protein
LPAPPGPVKVTNRFCESIRQAASISPCRPTKLVRSDVSQSTMLRDVAVGSMTVHQLSSPFDSAASVVSR